MPTLASTDVVPAGQRDVAEVELEVADPVLVARVQGRDGRRSFGLLPDSRADGDGRDRGRGEGGQQEQAEEDEPTDAPLRERPECDRGADDHDARRERSCDVHVVDVEHGEQPEQAGGCEQRAEDGREERRLLRRPGRRAGGGAWTLVVASSGGAASSAETGGVDGSGGGLNGAWTVGPLRHVPPDERAPDEGRREPDVAGSRPEVHLGEREERAEGEQADSDEQPGLVAASAQRLDGDRLVVVLAGDHEPRGEIEEQPGATDQRERGERDPVDERVDVEVAAESGGDAPEPAAVGGADEPPGRRVVGRGRVDRVGHREPPVDDLPPACVGEGALRHPARP